MRFRAAALACVASLIVAPATAAPGDLDRVAEHLAGVSSMTASFSQTDRAGKTLTGTLTLKRPGKVRFQYQKGVPLLIVGDGRALTMIDYQVNQVQRWPVGKSPLAVLLDPKRNLANVGRIVPTQDSRIVLLEARDRARPEYGVITLAFTRAAGAPGGLSLSGWSALDAQNNRTTVRLSNQRVNVAVSDGAFRWRDPRTQNRR